MSETILSSETIKSNYQVLLDRISNAANFAGRDPREIKLVAVTKEKSVQMIENAFEAGLRVFGENYADEALPKINALSRYFDIQWHMIGHIQSRKTKFVSKHFDYIHSLDSVKIAMRLDRYASEYGKIIPVLIEFNLSGEESKFGFQADQEEKWNDLLESIEQIIGLPNLSIKGIMTIPPYSDNAEDSRPLYKMLCRLQRFLQVNIPHASWSELSMGMSADYSVAIEEGATYIRVGQALFGPRD